MREIEFRGKLKRTGKWAYGNLNINKAGTTIITPDETPLGTYGEVDSETVGQYTGKLDCKANKIFEKDIVKGIRRTNQYEEYEYFEVKFHNGCFIAGNFNMHEFFDKFSHKEVIGNIYDNPELLEKED